MAAEEEVVLGGVGDVGVNGRPGGDIARTTGLVPLVHAEETRVVALLDSDQGDAWHVVGLKLHKEEVK